MRVVLEAERAMHPNEVSVQRAVCAGRGNTARQHIEEARIQECEAGMHRSSSPVHGVMVRVRGSYALLQSRNARVQRSSACLHMSSAHVQRDMSVVHWQRRVQSVDSRGKSACLGVVVMRHFTRAEGHCTAAARHVTSAPRDVRDAATYVRAAQRDVPLAPGLIRGEEGPMQSARKPLS